MVTLSVVLGGELIGTINVLHEEQYQTPERIALIAKYLSLLAKDAMLVAFRASWTAATSAQTAARSHIR